MPLRRTSAIWSGATVLVATLALSPVHAAPAGTRLPQQSVLFLGIKGGGESLAQGVERYLGPAQSRPALTEEERKCAEAACLEGLRDKYHVQVVMWGAIDRIRRGGGSGEDEIAVLYLHDHAAQEPLTEQSLCTGWKQERTSAHFVKMAEQLLVSSKAKGGPGPVVPPAPPAPPAPPVPPPQVVPPEPPPSRPAPPPLGERGATPGGSQQRPAPAGRRSYAHPARTGLAVLFGVGAAGAGAAAVTLHLLGGKQAVDATCTDPLTGFDGYRNCFTDYRTATWATAGAAGALGLALLITLAAPFPQTSEKKEDRP